MSDEDDEIWETVESVENETVDNIQVEISLPPTKKPRLGIKKVDREERLNLHKVHLLCLLSCGHIYNKHLNNKELQALLLSQTIETDLFALFEWYRQKMEITENTDYVQAASELKGDARTLGLLFGCLLRALGYQHRLVCSLHPIPLSFSKKSLYDKVAIRIWHEVFLDDWIPMDIITGSFNQVKSMMVPLNAPLQQHLLYVIAYQEQGTLSDITKKYTASWGAHTSKHRLTDSWWDITLWLYSKEYKDSFDIQDEVDFEKSIQSEKMPTTFNGFLNHPLYALERHLKRNEIIYPNHRENAIGTFRKELVYPRSLVKELKSKHQWLCLGKSIIEQPIKLDKKGSGLYGEWQTIPTPRPTSIEKNEYGNIEIFHPNMIPVGTVQVSLPFIEAAAKECGVEYAKAMVGFEYGKNTRPKYDGIILYEKDVETCAQLAAEKTAQAIVKEQEAREKRVYTRWKKMILGMLNKAELLKKYSC